jgi:hypothetical protein
MNKFLKEQKKLMMLAVAKLSQIERSEEIIGESKNLPIEQSDKLEFFRKSKLAGLHLQYGDLVTNLMRNFCDEMGLEIIDKNGATVIEMKSY